MKGGIFLGHKSGDEVNLDTNLVNVCAKIPGSFHNFTENLIMLAHDGALAGEGMAELIHGRGYPCPLGPCL